MTGSVAARDQKDVMDFGKGSGFRRSSKRSYGYYYARGDAVGRPWDILVQLANRAECDLWVVKSLTRGGHGDRAETQGKPKGITPTYPVFPCGTVGKDALSGGDSRKYKNAQGMRVCSPALH